MKSVMSFAFALAMSLGFSVATVSVAEAKRIQKPETGGCYIDKQGRRRCVQAR